jgi:hypothetical protein
LNVSEFAQKLIEGEISFSLAVASLCLSIGTFAEIFSGIQSTNRIEESSFSLIIFFQCFEGILLHTHSIADVLHMNRQIVTHCCSSLELLIDGNAPVVVERSVSVVDTSHYLLLL